MQKVDIYYKTSFPIVYYVGFVLIWGILYLIVSRLIMNDLLIYLISIFVTLFIIGSIKRTIFTENIFFTKKMYKKHSYRYDHIEFAFFMGQFKGRSFIRLYLKSGKKIDELYFHPFENYYSLISFLNNKGVKIIIEGELNKLETEEDIKIKSLDKKYRLEFKKWQNKLKK